MELFSPRQWSVREDSLLSRNWAEGYSLSFFVCTPKRKSWNWTADPSRNPWETLWNLKWRERANRTMWPEPYWLHVSLFHTSFRQSHYVQKFYSLLEWNISLHGCFNLLSRNIQITPVLRHLMESRCSGFTEAQCKKTQAPFGINNLDWIM